MIGTFFFGDTKAGDEKKEEHFLETGLHGGGEWRQWVDRVGDRMGRWGGLETDRR